MTEAKYAVTQGPQPQLHFIRSHDFLSEGASVVLVRAHCHGATHKHRVKEGETPSSPSERHGPAPWEPTLRQDLPFIQWKPRKILASSNSWVYA